MNFKDFLFNFLTAKIYRAYLATNTYYKSLELTETDKCLCLAPHSDDESIGMGGTLLKKANQFDIVCMTNGTGGLGGANDKEKIDIRKTEFEQAMQKINPNSFNFFEQVEDRELILYYKEVLKIDISQYDYVFVPNILDQHRDHKAVSILLNQLLSQKKHKETIKIVFYEVWQSLALPNSYIDISDVVEQKKELINIYKSQLASKNYTSKIIGLNNYRGLIPDLDYVEAFSIMDVELFRKICKIYNL